MICQDPLLAMNPVLRVPQWIVEILRAHHATGDPTELLAMAGMAAPARIGAALPEQISGGQRQRVTIAQALACRPALITLGTLHFAGCAARGGTGLLVPGLRDQLRTLFLVISHNPGVLAATADRLLLRDATV